MRNRGRLPEKAKTANYTFNHLESRVAPAIIIADIAMLNFCKTAVFAKIFAFAEYAAEFRLTPAT